MSEVEQEQEWQPVILAWSGPCGRVPYVVPEFKRVLGQKIHVAVKAIWDPISREEVHQVHPEDHVRMSEIAGTGVGDGPVYICEYVFTTD